MSTARATKLAGYERRYRELAARLAEIGYIATGSVDPALQPLRQVLLRLPRRSAPPAPSLSRHFTAKVEGKTVNKRLFGREDELYREWMANDRTPGVRCLGR